MAAAVRAESVCDSEPGQLYVVAVIVYRSLYGTYFLPLYWTPLLSPFPPPGLLMQLPQAVL